MHNEVAAWCLDTQAIRIDQRLSIGPYQIGNVGTGANEVRAKVTTNSTRTQDQYLHFLFLRREAISELAPCRVIIGDGEVDGTKQVLK